MAAVRGRNVIQMASRRSSVRIDVSARMGSEGRVRARASGQTLALLAVAGLALAALALAGIDTGALCLLPALALALPLAMRRYPGERVLASVSGVRRSRWLRTRSITPRGERCFAVAPHGGLLIARALAVRPPPALHAAS
jgi:hypothetical protein